MSNYLLQLAVLLASVNFITSLFVSHDSPKAEVVSCGKILSLRSMIQRRHAEIHILIHPSPSLSLPSAGYEGKNLLKIDTLKFTPEPLVLPGTFSIKLAGSLSRDITNLYVKARITKVFFNGRTRTDIPCIKGYGSW